MGRYQCETTVLRVFQTIDTVISTALPSQYDTVQVVLGAVDEGFFHLMRPRFSTIVAVGDHYIGYASHYCATSDAWTRIQLFAVGLSFLTQKKYVSPGVSEISPPLELISQVIPPPIPHE